MRLAVIGDRISHFQKQSDLVLAVEDRINLILSQLRPEIVDIYLNPGVGLRVAESCRIMDFPYRAIIPFRDHYTVWPEATQNRYRRACKKALEIVYTDRQPGFIMHSHPPDTFQKEKTFNMARWMARQLDVEAGDRLIATRVLPYKGYAYGFDGTIRETFNSLAATVMGCLGESMDGWYESTGPTSMRYTIRVNVALKERVVTTDSPIPFDDDIPF